MVTSERISAADEVESSEWCHRQSLRGMMVSLFSDSQLLITVELSGLESHLLVPVVTELVVISVQLCLQAVDFFPLAGGVVVVHHLNSGHN